MTAQEILQQYQKIQAIPGMSLPSLDQHTYSLDVSTEVMDKLDDVLAELNGFNPVSGWVGYQSGNHHFENQSSWKSEKDYGVLLNAELAGANNNALHIRYNGNGGWRVTTYEFSSGGEYIADKVKHIASFAKDGDTTLTYLRFWKNEANAIGVNPVFACFTGFGGKA